MKGAAKEPAAAADPQSNGEQGPTQYEREALAIDRAANGIAERSNRIAEDQRSYAFVQMWLGAAGVLFTGFAAFWAYRATHWAKEAATAAGKSAKADNLALQATLEAGEAARKDAVEAARRADEQITAAKEANIVARLASYTEQRAGLELTDISIETDLAWNENGDLRATFKPTFMNIGRTPARGAWVDMILYYDMTRDPRAVRRELMENGKNHPAELGTLVFPGRPYIQPTNIGINAHDLADWDARWAKDYGGQEGQLAMNGFLPLRLIGCVTYRTSLGDEPHQTAFTLDINPLDDTNGKAFRRNVNVRQDRLHLQRSILGDIEAT